MDEMVTDLVEQANSLLATLTAFQHVDGVPKLCRRIRQELAFLRRVQGDVTSYKEEHLKCSNLQHLGSVVQCLAQSDRPVSVLKVFRYGLDQDQAALSKVSVDIVAQDGQQWIKVISRSSRTLQLQTTGDQDYGQKSLVDQAEEYQAAAQANLFLFRPPSVHFVFVRQVTPTLISILNQLNVDVRQLEAHQKITPSRPPTDQQPFSDLINLDVTAMIAFVSAMTNEPCHVEQLKEPILKEQILMEQQEPMLPFLRQIIRDKVVICCESALHSFRSIMNHVGGDAERLRAEQLLREVVQKVVPDEPSDRVMRLECRGRIKARSKIIFGTGDQLKAVTLTSNAGFFRAAKQLDVHLAVILHESRALTETKKAQLPDL